MSGQPDPKDLILQNKGLVIVYAVALIPLALSFFVIGGMQDTTTKKLQALGTNSKTLKRFKGQVANPDPNNPLYTRKDLEVLQKLQDLHKEEVASLGGVVQARDTPLERRFDKFKSAAKIDTDDFNNELRSRLTNLASEERFGALVSHPNDPDKTFVNVEEAEDETSIALIQKRFWIQEAVLEALKKGGALRMAAEIEFLPPPTEEEPAYKRIPVRLSFFASGKDVPLVVREVLAQEISFKVSRMKVEKSAWTIRHDFNAQFQVPLEGLVFEKPVYEVELNEHEEFGNWERWVPEPPLMVELEVEAFDFNNAEDE